MQIIIYWKYPSPKLISMFWMGRLIILSFVLSSTCMHHFSWWFQFWSGYHQLTAGCLKNTGVRLDVVLYQLYQLSAVMRYAINNTGRAGWSSQLVMHIQGAPIKNNPLEKILYLRNCSRFFHQIYAVYRGGFTPCIQQIAFKYLVWFQNYNYLNLKVHFSKWTRN